MTAQSEAADAGGLTLADVRRWGLAVQYALCADRYGRLQQLLRDAQQTFTSGVWAGGRDAPFPISNYAGGAHSALPGGNVENSYYLTDSREFAAASSSAAALHRARAVAEAHAWTSELRMLHGGFSLWAVTEDAYRVEFWASGSAFRIAVMSPLFWGDVHGLWNAVRARRRKSPPTAFPPGGHELFPEWDASARPTPRARPVPAPPGTAAGRSPAPPARCSRTIPPR